MGKMIVYRESANPTQGKILGGRGAGAGLGGGWAGAGRGLGGEGREIPGAGRGLGGGGTTDDGGGGEGGKFRGGPSAKFPPPSRVRARDPPGPPGTPRGGLLIKGLYFW
jgi:hypothetical protein